VSTETRVGAAILTQALVTTKVRAPRTRPNLVTRPRLREAIARNEVCPLTLLSAPAGFGKTTLLAEWSEDRSDGGGPVAWISLEGSDNDPARFLTYLVGALREVEEGIGEGVLASLRSPGMPPIEALMGGLVNDLAEVAHEITVVLDDYHLIDSERVHEAVSFLLEHLPENVRLVVSGRTDPPLPLTRLRARGQMTEIRAADLRFTPEEAAAFLNEVMGLSLSEVDVAALEEVTEGWVAALQLAALSMRGRKDPSGFVESFSGSNRHVLDFLAEEVLGRQTEGVREFLLATSVLERMSAPLCDALTGRSDAQGMLERLERENLFVVALDDERDWYRYHHLFRDFLRGRLRRESPELLSESHLRAASWYEREGWASEAVEHALAAGDDEWAARLVDRHIGAMLTRGEGTTVRRWMSELPPALVRSRPRLCLAQATRAMLDGRLDEFERLLDDAERALAATGNGSDEQAGATPAETAWAPALLADVGGTVAVWRAELARLRGDADRTKELARRAIARLSEGDHVLRMIADWNLARAHWMRGELAEAERAMRGELAKAVAEVRAGRRDPYLVLHAWWDFGRVRSAQGRLRSALRTYRDALELVAEAGDSSAPPTGFAHVGLAEILREQNDLDAALEHADEGVERCRSLSNRRPLAAGLAILARIRQALGDPAGALEAIGEAEQVGLSPQMTALFNPVPMQRARLMLIQGEIVEAARWTAERGLGVEDEVSYLREREHLVLARVLLAQGKPEQALRLLEKLREQAEAAGRTGSEIEILALQALALWATNEKERAVRTLTQSLALAEPEGYLRTFADEGAPMGDLLSEVFDAQLRSRPDAATPSVPARYLAKLLAALAREDVAPAAAAERLPEPLSGRELEVLALVASGMSNKEIAGRLFVSVTTVKTHINNLYRKLDARSRIQAVARAREMGIL
jgi:LuxR family transcriptional regulator, maltose regulon positive regulatory protein